MFKKIKQIHFIGIGGSGMSGIAEVLLKLGYRVSGSDASKNAVTLRLEKLGAVIHEGHAAAHMKGADVIVTSTAIPKSNPEVKEAHRLGVPVIPRIEMLAELARLKYTIAVAGTHGKTTTTSLVAQILKYAKLDPTVVVGGRLKAVGTGGVLGMGDYLVAEADESDGSFLKLSPTLAIVTNIDDDHLDYYKTMEILENAFVTFANRIPFYGATYLCGEDPGVKRILKRLSRRCARYGFNSKFDLYADKIHLDERGARFDVHHRGKRLGWVELPLSGRHNVLNALAAIAVAVHLDISFDVIANALAHFEGVGRRIEVKGEVNGVMVVDDYGHHPTEIRATLAAVKARWPHRRLVVLFQPHRYSRTKLLASEFSQALKAATALLLMPVYAAGEKPLRGVSTALISNPLPKNKWRAWSWDQPISMLIEQLKPNDIFLTLGAGDVWKAGEQVLKQTQRLGYRLAHALPALESRVKDEEPLSRHSTWGIGGPAEAFIEVHTRQEFIEIVSWCRLNHLPFFILGWGSNVLLPEAGLRGVVVRLRGDFESIRFEGERAWVGAGVHLPKLSNAAAERGLSGVEALSGVPGTVGGALITNAGTPRGVIGDVLNSVDVLDGNGAVVTLNLDQIVLSYRHTNLAGKFILSAGLILQPDDPATVKTRMKQELDSRAKTQPLGTKNVGSVFRNPPNDHAARLIEAAGLKGKVIGRMRFSPKHANFIENLGGATAENALELIHHAQQTVKEKFNVDLVTEVIVVKQPEPLS